MDRVVAIKTILTHAAEGPQGADYRERFFREARAAGRLSHPGIVTVFDVSEFEGTPFLVMEYVPGRTLQSVLESGERFDSERTCEVGLQIAEALDYAHKNGVIHRDVKPANILITTDNRAKIADFGVAKLASVQVTSTGQLLGTPAFMAPEQFTGAPIDGRADLFAAGVVLYWMATGDKPFTGDTLMAVSYKVVHSDPVPPRKLNPGIPRELEAMILKCMEKDPSLRYQTGEELAKDLRAVRENRPIATLLGVTRPDPNQTAVAGAVAPVIPASASGLGGAPPDANGFDSAETVAAVPARATTKSGGITGSGSRTAASPPATVVQAPATQVAQPAKPEKGSKFKWIMLAVIAMIIIGGLKDIAKTIFQPKQPAQQQTAPAPVEPEATGTTAPDAKKAAPSDVSTAVKQAGEASKAATKSMALFGKDGKPLLTKSDKVKLEIQCVDRATVIFRGAGQPAGSYSMKPGESITLEADKEANFFTDNPGGLRVKLNGKELSLGEQRQPRQVTLTPEGIDETRSQEPWANFERRMRELAKRPPVVTVPFGPTPPGESLPPDTEGEFGSKKDKAGSIGSPMRQKELSQTPGSARVFLSSPGIPEFLTLIVRVNGEILYRRDGNMRYFVRDDSRGKVQLKQLQTTPLAEERFLPPGANSFQVFIGWGSRRATQEVSGEFKAGQRRTLRIELHHDPQAAQAGQRVPAQFSVHLE